MILTSMAASVAGIEALGFCFKPLRRATPDAAGGSRDQGLFAVCASRGLAGARGNESNRRPGEKCNWWRRGCNSTHTGGEASTCPPKGWRVSDSALGIVLKAQPG
jgi:hypothetical protein